MKIGVLIPCYNGALTIGDIVKGAMAYIKDVIVVDDGSLDDTFNKAEKAGAFLLRHKVNQGKGNAIKTGFDYILQNTDWDAVILMDADLQHDWEEIPKFVNMMETTDADIIIGSRMQAAANMPWIRWATNKVTSYIISRAAKQHVPDSQCGYRLIKTKVIRNLELSTGRFDTESEMLVKASSKGFKIDSVPIKSIYKDEKSHIRPFRDTLRFIKLVRSFK